MAVAHPVLKVLTSDQWDRLLGEGETPGSPVDVEDGFVHLSTPDQVGGTIARHFADADLLIVLTLDAVELGDALRWEPSRGGQDFPHLYGPLRLADVRGVRRVTTALAPRPDPPTGAQEPDPDAPPPRYLLLDDEPRDADERTMLETLLDWYRDGVIAKVAGLSDEQARQRHVDSASTIVGLVKHLAFVEDFWFERRFSGRPLPDVWADADWDADRDWEFTSARAGTLDEAVELYRGAIARSRAVQAAASLDDLAARPGHDRGPFTMRWMLLHVLEETARHLGHLDVLRELTDGATGE